MKRIILKIFCNQEEGSIKRDSHLHFLRESITDTCLLSSLDRLSFLSGKRTLIRAYPLDPRGLRKYFFSANLYKDHTCQVLRKSKSGTAHAPLIFAYNLAVECAGKSGAKVLRVRYFSL